MITRWLWKPNCSAQHKHRYSLTIHTQLAITVACSVCTTDHYTVTPRCKHRKASVMYAVRNETLQLICSTPWMLFSPSKNCVTPDNTSQTYIFIVFFILFFTILRNFWFFFLHMKKQHQNWHCPHQWKSAFSVQLVKHTSKHICLSQVQLTVWYNVSSDIILSHVQ